MTPNGKTNNVRGKFAAVESILKSLILIDKAT